MSRSSSLAVKLEPTFLVENEEDILDAGYVKGKRRKQGGADRLETWRLWSPRRGVPGGQEFQRSE